MAPFCHILSIFQNQNAGKRHIHFQEHLRKFSNFPFPYHPCMVYLPTFTTKINFSCIDCIGKYTVRPMDPMVFGCFEALDFQVEGGFMDDKWEIIKVPSWIPWNGFFISDLRDFFWGIIWQSSKKWYYFRVREQVIKD